jgi:hypothetical protein
VFRGGDRLSMNRGAAGFPDESLGVQSLRATGQWHIWGQDLNLTGISADSAAGVNSAFNGNNAMWAIPCWLPEPITIVTLAMGLVADIGGGGGQGVPVGGEHGWVGLAPDAIVSGEHSPGPTISGSAVRVVGAGSGAKKIRGGTVAVRSSGREFFWLVGQTQMTGVAGAEYYGMAMGNWPSWGGLDDLTGLAVGATMPGAVTAHSAVGYCSPVASVLTYTLGRDFPTSGARRLRTKNDGEATANQLFSNNMPIILWQFTR